MIVTIVNMPNKLCTIQFSITWWPIRSQSPSDDCRTPNSWILWISRNSWKSLNYWTREDSNLRKWGTTDSCPPANSHS